MRVLWTLVTVAACLCHNYGSTRAAPARTSDEVLLGQVDVLVAVLDDKDSNEITVKPFEEKCIVDGKSYSHAQVVSYDANSRCICVAGNVYCFWHGSPSATTDSSPNEAESNGKTDHDEPNSSRTTEPARVDSSIASNDTYDESFLISSQSTKEADSPDVYNTSEREKSEVDSNEEEDDDSINDEDEQGVGSEESTDESVATSPRTDTPTAPITCVVLDRTYRVGDVLPHNTGNCIECSCGPEGHVICAPRDCVSIVPHRDYREENLQIPIAGDWRGIDENF